MRKNIKVKSHYFSPSVLPFEFLDTKTWKSITAKYWFSKNDISVNTPPLIVQLYRGQKPDLFCIKLRKGLKKLILDISGSSFSSISGCIILNLFKQRLTCFQHNLNIFKGFLKFYFISKRNYLRVVNTLDISFKII